MEALAATVLVAIPVWQLWKMNLERAARTIPANTKDQQ